MNESYLLNYSQILTLFMVMLGPLRLLVPYVKRTIDLNQVSLRKLAASSSLLALITLIVGGLIGRMTILKWHIENPILLLTGAIIFFFSALRPLIMTTPDIDQPKTIAPSFVEVALNMIITPYGMASVIVLISVSHDSKRTLGVFTTLAIIMVLNLVFMIFGRKILKLIGALPLQIVNKALSVLQLALSIELIYKSLQLLEV
jgi:multiple antibiotic resistance protein